MFEPTREQENAIGRMCIASTSGRVRVAACEGGSHCARVDVDGMTVHIDENGDTHEHEQPARFTLTLNLDGGLSTAEQLADAVVHVGERIRDGKYFPDGEPCVVYEPGPFGRAGEFTVRFP